MWASLIHYHRPATVKEALELLARSSPRSVPLAGGTWLVAQRDQAVEAVVDLDGLSLAYVETHDRRLRLGAMTSLQALTTSPWIQKRFDGLLVEAARRHAPRAIRNVATLGGTLVVGEPTAEVLLALLVLEALVVVRTPARRVVSVEAFLCPPGRDLPPAGLITEIVVPLPSPGSGAAIAEVRRTPGDGPIVNAAALVERKGGVTRSVRLALGAVAPSPIRLPSVEASLAGEVMDDDLVSRVALNVSVEVRPPSDTRASAEYRREMSGVVAGRALREAWARAQGE